MDNLNLETLVLNKSWNAFNIETVKESIVKKIKRYAKHLVVNLCVLITGLGRAGNIVSKAVAHLLLFYYYDYKATCSDEEKDMWLIMRLCLCVQIKN